MNELVAARKADLRSDEILFWIHPGLMQIDYTKPHRVRVSGQNIFSSLFFSSLLCASRFSRFFETSVNIARNLQHRESGTGRLPGVAVLPDGMTRALDAPITELRIVSPELLAAPICG